MLSRKTSDNNCTVIANNDIEFQTSCNEKSFDGKPKRPICEFGKKRKAFFCLALLWINV